MTIMAKQPKILGIIPARLNSTRLPGKMLLDMLGKPLIVRTYEQAKKAKMLDAVVVATDSLEIKEAVEAFGGKVLLTSNKPKTGSDRVAEAAEKFKEFTPDIVLNIQGDEPLMPPSAINKTAQLLIGEKRAVMSTVASRFIQESDLSEPGLVKVVTDKNGYALYFSRSVIPNPRVVTPIEHYYNHIGIYGYKRDFLKQYVKLKQTPLEIAESLEQLRALENGFEIIVGIGKFERAEVNEAHEFKKALAMLRAKAQRYIP
jgi:3-deoxy-manno-octulosonate cytidylyltransferase (CMP-KDO synthetase)